MQPSDQHMSTVDEENAKKSALQVHGFMTAAMDRLAVCVMCLAKPQAGKAPSWRSQGEMQRGESAETCSLLSQLMGLCARSAEL